MRVELSLNSDGIFWWVGGLIGGVTLQYLYHFETIWMAAFGIGALVFGGLLFDAVTSIAAGAMTDYQRKRRSKRAIDK
jgi:hypothetical protein